MAGQNRSSGQERWLRFFNTVLYNALAPLYDSLDWLTFGAWWRLVSRALDYVPAGGRVLEVGFGPGKLHVQLARRADLLAGLDLARGMCRLTRQRLLRQGLVPRIVRGSVYDLPYPTGGFDCRGQHLRVFRLSGRLRRHARAGARRDAPAGDWSWWTLACPRMATGPGPSGPGCGSAWATPSTTCPP